MRTDLDRCLTALQRIAAGQPIDEGRRLKVAVAYLVLVALANAMLLLGCAA